MPLHELRFAIKMFPGLYRQVYTYRHHDLCLLLGCKRAALWANTHIYEQVAHVLKELTPTVDGVPVELTMTITAVAIPSSIKHSGIAVTDYNCWMCFASEKITGYKTLFSKTFYGKERKNHGRSHCKVS